MAHRNARLTVHGRQLLVERVRNEGWEVAHVAKAMGISRQCAYRWLRRFDEEGSLGNGTFANLKIPTRVVSTA